MFKQVNVYQGESGHRMSFKRDCKIIDTLKYVLVFSKHTAFHQIPLTWEDDDDCTCMRDDAEAYIEKKNKKITAW